MLPILRHILTSAPKILLFDSFNRPDTETGIGDSEKGASWYWHVNPTRGRIQAQAAGPSGSSDAYCTADVGRSDYAMTVKLRSVDVTASKPLIFRFAGTTDLLRLRVVSGNYCFYDWGTSVLNNIAPAASGDIVKVVLKGSNIKFYVNGEFKAEVAHDKNTGSTRCGVGFDTTTNPVWVDEIKVVSL